MMLRKSPKYISSTTANLFAYLTSDDVVHSEIETKDKTIHCFADQNGSMQLITPNTRPGVEDSYSLQVVKEKKNAKRYPTCAEVLNDPFLDFSYEESDTFSASESTSVSDSSSESELAPEPEAKPQNRYGL